MSKLSELTYEQVFDVLVTFEACKEALDYLEQCMCKRKTIEESYLGIPKLSWVLWLFDALRQESDLFMKESDLLKVIGRFESFYEDFEVLQGRYNAVSKFDEAVALVDKYRLQLLHLYKDEALLAISAVRDML